MAVCAIAFIAITGIIADRGRLPRPVLPLCVVVVVIACYAVLIVYPSTGGVYATTIIANAAARTWFPVSVFLTVPPFFFLHFRGLHCQSLSRLSAILK